MPTLSASGYPVPVAPSVAPLDVVPGGFQDIRAPAEAFGALTAAALANLGTDFKEVAANIDKIQTEYAKTEALDKRTNAERRSNDILYGNKDDPSSIGYFGLQGKARLDARKDTIDKLNQVYAEERQGLSPMAQKLFDDQTRTHRIGVEASVAHSSIQALKEFQADTDKGVVKLQEQKADQLALGNDLGAWNASVGEGVQKIGEIGKERGTPPALIEAQQNAFRAGRILEKASALSERNPKAAMELIDNNRGVFVDPSQVEKIYSGAKTRLTQEVGKELATVTNPANPNHINFGRTGALGDPTKPGWEAENIIEAAAPSGAKFRVHKQAKADFEGFLKDLEAAGYKIDTTESGGHNVRQITGGTGLSEHAFGTAIDINPSRNPYSKEGKKVTDLPANVAEIAAKHNLEWGGNWTSPVDTMHFQWRGPKGKGTADNNLGGLRRPGINATKAEGGFQEFETPEAGVQAIANNLQRYAAGGVVTANNPDGKPLNTIRSIVSVWAPSNENDTARLINSAAKLTGYGPDQVLDLKQPDVMRNMVRAIVQNEQGKLTPQHEAAIEQGLKTAVPPSPVENQYARQTKAINEAPGYTAEEKEIAHAEAAKQHRLNVIGQDTNAYNVLEAIGRRDPAMTNERIDQLVSEDKLSVAGAKEAKAKLIDEQGKVLHETVAATVVVKEGATPESRLATELAAIKASGQPQAVQDEASKRAKIAHSDRTVGQDINKYNLESRILAGDSSITPELIDNMVATQGLSAEAGRANKKLLTEQQGRRLAEQTATQAQAETDATGGIPTSPLAGQVAAIRTSGQSQEVQDAAIVYAHKEHAVKAMGQDAANYEVQKAIVAGAPYMTPEYIDSLVKTQRISPAQGTEAHKDLQKKKDAEMKALAQIARVDAAGTVNAIPLDPKSDEDKKALATHYATKAAQWVQAGVKPEDMWSMSIAYVRQYNMVPTQVAGQIRGALHGGNPRQAIMAAQTVQVLRNHNPQLIADIGDNNDISKANLINEYAGRGYAPEEALKLWTAAEKVSDTDRKARDTDFEDARGKTTKERAESDARWVSTQQDNWGRDPEVPPMLRTDFAETTRLEYQRHGNLEAARRTALDVVNRVWGRSSVGGSDNGRTERYEKFAPEKFYSVPSLTPAENTAWMNEELLKAVGGKQTLQDPNNPITVDRLRVYSDPTQSSPDGGPVYQVWFVKGNERTVLTKPDGNAMVWYPQYAGSADSKRRATALSVPIDKARRAREDLLAPRQPAIPAPQY